MTRRAALLLLLLLTPELRLGETSQARSVLAAAAAAGCIDAVSVGGFHGLTLASNTTQGFGEGGAGQLDVPPALAGLTLGVAAGGFFSCALHRVSLGSANTSVSCWGAASAGVVDVPPSVKAGSGPTALAAGGYHACVVLASGSAACWGANGAGQVSPLPAAATSGVASLALGSYHSCAAKTSSGSVACWGRDDRGQVSGLPSFLAAGAGASTRIACGGYHCCAWGWGPGGSNLTCWGAGAAGQTLPPSSLSLAAPIGGACAGGYFSCALQGGSVSCWGSSSKGETMVPPGATDGNVASLACGWYGACAVKSNGSLVCWGGSLGRSALVTLAGTDVSITTASTSGSAPSGSIVLATGASVGGNRGAITLSGSSLVVDAPLSVSDSMTARQLTAGELSLGSVTLTEAALQALVALASTPSAAPPSPTGTTTPTTSAVPSSSSSAVPSSSPSPSASRSATLSVSATLTPTVSPSASGSPTPSASWTATGSASPSATASVTPTPTATASASGAQACPAGWTRVGYMCYRTTATTQTWSGAAAACAALNPNATLGEFGTLEEASGMQSTSCGAVGTPTQAFIGASCDASLIPGAFFAGTGAAGQTGGWRWASGRDASVLLSLPSSMWNAGEPNNSANNERCMTINPMRLNDAVCGDSNQGACCSIELVRPSRSPTPSSSPSATASTTLSSSATPSATPSVTQSALATPSSSLSTTPSTTQAASVTASTTSSASATLTASATSTGSSFATLSASATSTGSSSATLTASATSTGSSFATLSASATSTGSSSATASPSYFTQSCPSGWTRAGYMCYRATNGAQPWSSGAAACAALHPNATLAEFETLEEANGLEATSCGIGTPTEVYLGAACDASLIPGAYFAGTGAAGRAGGWRWASGRDPTVLLSLPLSMWGTGEPNDTGNERCLNLNPALLNDVICSRSARACCSIELVRPSRSPSPTPSSSLSTTPSTTQGASVSPSASGSPTPSASWTATGSASPSATASATPTPTATASVSGAQACPAGWTRVGYMCYRTTATTQTWSGGTAACAALHPNAVLGEFDTVEEARGLQSTSCGAGTAQVFIGASCDGSLIPGAYFAGTGAAGQTGGWRWASGRSASTLLSLPSSMWSTGEPNNNNNFERCMAINPTLFWDLDCRISNLAACCSIELVRPPSPTPSSSPSITPSTTQGASLTASTTASVSPTGTVSSTSTGSSSATLSVSATSTASSTVTSTRSPVSISPSQTASATATISGSQSRTATASRTASATATSSGSQSRTASASRTVSRSQSRTASVSSSSSASPTVSTSASSSSSASPSATASQSPLSQACPAGWTRVGYMCYRTTATTQAWSGAAAACAALNPNATLGEFGTLEEASGMQSTSCGAAGTPTQAFIGAACDPSLIPGAFFAGTGTAGQTGGWRWASGRDASVLLSLPSSMWGTGEPNDEGNNERCLSLTPTGMLLNDAVCDDANQAACCSIELVRPSPPSGVPLCCSAAEDAVCSLDCAAVGKTTITDVVFASYGLPTGCPDPAAGGCDVDVTAAASASCVGQAACEVLAANSLAGDPCPDVPKRLAMVVLCSGDPAPAG